VTKEDFERILVNRMSETSNLCVTKGLQYAQHDRLHNFKVASRELECSPERALLGMVVKQQVWIKDRIKELDIGTDNFSIHDWDERIGDVIVYMILLEALIHERKRVPPT
jgi:hypothetical protein